MKFLWAHTGESLSNAYKMSFWSSPGMFGSIKAIASETRLSLVRKTGNQRVQSDTGRLITYDELLENDDDLSSNSFLAIKLIMIYRLQCKRLYRFVEAVEALLEENHDDNCKNNTQDGSKLNDNLSASQYERKMTVLKSMR